MSLPVECIEGIERGEGGKKVDYEGRLSSFTLAVQHIEAYIYSKQTRSQSGVTYKPTEPWSASIIAKNIIYGLTAVRLTVGPGDQKNCIQSYSQGERPVLLKLVPVMSIDLLRQPQEKVQRVQVGLDALRQRSAADKPGHGENGDAGYLIIREQELEP